MGGGGYLGIPTSKCPIPCPKLAPSLRSLTGGRFLRRFLSAGFSSSQLKPLLSCIRKKRTI